MRILSVILALVWALPVLAETKTYEVQGMTCGSCVKAIKAKVCQLPGLESCQVELGKVTLSGATLNDDAVKTEIGKAGEYTVSKIETATAAKPAARKKATH